MCAVQVHKLDESHKFRPQLRSHTHTKPPASNPAAKVPNPCHITARGRIISHPRAISAASHSATRPPTSVAQRMRLPQYASALTASLPFAARTTPPQLNIFGDIFDDGLKAIEPYGVRSFLRS